MPALSGTDFSLPWSEPTVVHFAQQEGYILVTLVRSHSFVLDAQQYIDWSQVDEWQLVCIKHPLYIYVTLVLEITRTACLQTHVGISSGTQES